MYQVKVHNNQILDSFLQLGFILQLALLTCPRAVFGDRLLGLNLFPESVYAEQTAWYKTHASADWQLLTASWATTTAVRDLLVEAVKDGVSDGLNEYAGWSSDLMMRPVGDLYDTVTGEIAIGWSCEENGERREAFLLQ
ncbi:hypothetical protein K438DRAFT_1760654 [Mycena galopus ATCC 62051]|nr:hypothetical protein K438DRAFT_1760654 [Mycena galopus ATCC 62051]